MPKKFYLILLIVSMTGFSQSTRITDRNDIGWFSLNATFTLSDKIGIHTEYQWRRQSFIENWQQGLLRLGVNYKLTDQAQFRVGYAWAETFAYGDIPINGFGKTFTEHRAFEMLGLNSKVAQFGISQRFMLEQRWVGRFSASDLQTEDSFLFTNRFRYLFRIQIPILQSKPTGAYIALYDELFIGFGNNVGENVFDQNRFGALVGCQLNDNLRLEGGYLNQIIQLGREIEGRNVFQKNSGFIVSAIFNFDFRKTDLPK